MSTEKRVSWTSDGQPRVVITIEGWHDAFRFAWAMSHLQCEFADVARRIGGTLRRHVGPQRFNELHAHFTSNTKIGWIRDEEGEGCVAGSDGD